MALLHLVQRSLRLLSYDAMVVDTPTRRFVARTKTSLPNKMLPGDFEEQTCSELTQDLCPLT